MKSNVIALEKNMDFDVIYNEIDKVCVYNDLDKKSGLRLRLLTEELLGLIPHFMEYCNGELWVENQDSNYEIHVSFIANEPTDLEKERLIDISNTRKNAAYVGIMGKIRGLIEGMIEGYKLGVKAGLTCSDQDVQGFYMAGAYNTPSYSVVWNLNNYSKNVNEDHQNGDKEEEWDELEKSIIANLADDLSVGIAGNKVDLIVKKAF